MKRLGLVLLVFAMAPLVMGGGMAPGIPGPGVGLTGPAISGVVVVDTHRDDTACTSDPTVPGITCIPNGQGATPGPKAKYISMRLKKGPATTSAIYRLPAVFAVFQGCDANITGSPSSVSQRFGFRADVDEFNGLRAWTPQAIVDRMMLDLGISDPGTAKPVITDFDNAVCTVDPQNPSPAQGAPGILSFEVVIQFVK